jgi:hypothetical protein
MAETYSTEYTNLFITKPPVKTQGLSVHPKVFPFAYSQVLAGDIGDTCVIAQLPPFATLDMVKSWISGEGFTATVTLSMGWKAYTDRDGVVQALSATGLMNVADVTDTTFVLTAGMNSNDGTFDDHIPVIASRLKAFHNVTPIDIYVTFGTAVPGLTGELVGVLYYYNIG